MNPFNVLYNEFSDEEEEEEEGEIVESRQKSILMACGRAFWEEQQKGKVMKWGDWCWTQQDDENIEKNSKK